MLVHCNVFNRTVQYATCPMLLFVSYYKKHFQIEDTFFETTITIQKRRVDSHRVLIRINTRDSGRFYERISKLSDFSFLVDLYVSLWYKPQRIW